MRSLAASLLCVACLIHSTPVRAEPSDGGVLAVDYPDKGLVRVVEARRGEDAGTLGPGWWLTDERLVATAQRVTKAENAEMEANARVRAANERLPYIFAAGVVAGFGAAFATFKLVNDVVRK